MMSDETTVEGLEEIPEVDFKEAKVVANPYAERVLDEGIDIDVRGQPRRRIQVQTGKGRPVAHRVVGKTTPKSVRFPDEIWRALEQRASDKGLSLHAALRAAILEWLDDAA